MKVLFVFIAILILVDSSDGQWRKIGDTRVFAFGAHDTDLFASIQYPSGTHTVRFDRERNFTVVRDADTGLQGATITSFASFGSYFFAGPIDARAYLSSDDGAHWSTVNAKGPVFSSDVALFATLGTSIAQSLDSGKNWIRTSLTLSEINAFASFGSCVLFSGDQSLWRLFTSGSDTSWHQVSPPLSNLKSLAFVHSRMFAANGNAGDGIIWSSDSGNNWTSLSWNRGRVYSLLGVNSLLFAGTDSGITVSSDFGASWKDVSEGLPQFSQINLAYVFDTLVFVAGSSGNKEFSFYRPINEMAPPKRAVQAIASQDTISIYPNPTLSSIRIDFGSAAVRRVELLDVLGASKQVLAPRESSLTLDLTSLPSGTYFLRFETEKGTVMCKIQKE